MKIAKLILHYKTTEVTRDLCRTIQGDDVYVIDNGSPEPFSADDLKIQVIRFETNLGFTPNWNRILEQFLSNFPYDAFWLMNSDIRLTPKDVERVHYVMENYDIHMLTPSYNCWLSQCHNHASIHPREVKCIEFTAPVIRRDVFAKIGMFDNVFVRGYGVEFDWALRMQKAGLKLYCDDGCSFFHIGQQTINSTEGLKDYEDSAVDELARGMTRKYGPRWKPMIQTKLDVFKPTNKMSVAVYTTIFNDYATLKSVPRQSVRADYYCITDNENVEFATAFGEKPEGEPWNIVKVDYPSRDLHPRMRAKFFKLFPWECPHLDKYNLIIFIDGSIEITSPEFVRFMVDSLGHGNIALFKHPQRDCIYEEAKASTPLLKYQSQNIQGQVDFYRPMYPKNGGLWACGVMVRRNRNEKMREVMTKWWWENIKWTYQDQISFPVVCRLSSFAPVTLPGNQVKNPYFKIHWHDDFPKDSKKGKKK